jgi:hypothetical protein
MRKRLVEQQHARIAQHGSRQRRTLTFASGQSRRPVAQMRVDIERACNLSYARVDCTRARAPHTQRKSQVFVNRQVREERVVLKYHRDAPALRRQMHQVAAIELQAPGIGALQSGDHAKQTGFAGAAGAQHDERFTVVDGK